MAGGVVVTAAESLHAALAQGGTEARAPEHAEALRALDVLFAGFDQLVARIDDQTHHATTIRILDALKARRRALDARFDQGFFNDLRLDVQHEFQRAAVWLAPLPCPPRPMTSSQADRLPPSGSSLGEEDVALLTIDWQIQALERRAGAGETPSNPAMQTVRERRAAVGKNFTREGYEALLGAMEVLARRRSERPGTGASR